MSHDVQTVDVTIQIEVSEDIDTDELVQITRRLMFELEDVGVETVEPVRGGDTLLGGKGVDPVTWGALAVVVLQTTLPKMLELLQAWSLRGQGHSVKIKAQLGKRSVEVEYPAKMKPDELREHIGTVMEALEKDNKVH